MRIIDVHTHPVFMHGGKKPDELKKLIAHGRSYGIEHMITLGDVLVYGPKPNVEQVRLINNDNIAILRAHPKYFTAFICLNPLLGEKAVMAEAERCASLPGFKGIKLEISNNARDACMKHVAKAAREFNLVVLQHTWSMTNIKQRSFHTDPADTALFARRFPDVKIIMAHLTGCGFRGVLEIKGHDNVWVDTSGGYPEEGLIEYAVEHLGAEHVVYGSDLPIRENSVTIGRILGADIPESAKQKILHDNTAKLLGLA